MHSQERLLNSEIFYCNEFDAKHCKQLIKLYLTAYFLRLGLLSIASQSKIIHWYKKNSN